MGEQLSFIFDAPKNNNNKTVQKTVTSNKSLSQRPIEKVYYSIGEVALLLKVSPSLIRFWESEFSALKPKKNARGVRKFKEKDITLLKSIYHLVKEKGYTINGAKEALKKGEDEIIYKQQTVEKLKELRNFLLEIKKKL